MEYKVDYKLYPILYVDDEKGNLLAFQSNFIDNFTIITSSNPEDALKIIEQNPSIAAVISDHRLGKNKMNGLDLLKKINLDYPDIIRILLTAYDEFDIAYDGINKANIYKYILKPWKPDAVKQDIKEAIEKNYLTKKLQQTQVSLVQKMHEKAATVKELEQSNLRFRELFNNMNNGVAVYEPTEDGKDFIFIDFNNAAEKIDDIKRETLIGKSVLDVFPGVKDFGLFDLFQKAWETGMPQQHPITMYKDDRLIGWRWNNVYKLPTGEIVAIYTDETKRKEAEIALIKSEAQKRSILDASIDAIMYCDTDLRIIWANKTAAKTVNKKIEELIGHKCHEIFLNSDTQCEDCPCKRAIISGKMEHKVIYHECLDDIGMSYWEAYGIPTKDEDGRIIGVIEVSRNITDRKRDEKTMKEALQKAKEADRLKSAFLANMSHEIRTPLNPILAYTDLMLDDELTEEHREFLEIIKDSVNLLTAIIQDILDISKIEAEQIEIEMIPVSVYDLFNTIKSNFQTLISNKKKDIILSINFPDNISKIIISDPTRLKQIMNNLMSNAVKFTDEGFIEYGVLLKNDNMLEFYVKDSGIGIPADKQREIFSPFHQADVSHTRQYGGTGLGLTISKKLIELMGGEIKLESDVGENHGSSFYFTIPYKPQIVKESNTIYKSDIKSNNVIKSKILETKTNYTVMIVEDNISNQQLDKKIIERAGYNAIISNNGMEAISIYKSDPSIDLILMDIEMPVLDGISATKAIRELEAKEKRDNRIPIIALTAYAMKGDRERCIDAGCDSYLSKPIILDEFKNLVSEYLMPPKN